MIATPLNKSKLDSIFDDQAKEVISFFIFKAVFSQPELVTGQKAIPIQIPKEHIEQWGVQALGANSVGAGSYPVDLIDESKGYAADIKMLSFSPKTDKGNDANGESGETSLSQKFEDENLDEKFVKSDHNAIIAAWIKILNDKFLPIIKNKKIKKIYYFIFIRERDYEILNDNEGRRFHLCAMEVDTSKFHILSHKKTLKKSIKVKNFIDDDYGSIKVYKSKKRMELRLRPRKWIETNKVITFDLGKISSEIKDLKETSIEEKYLHSIKDFKRLYKNILEYEEE
tara:strand:+ start:1297 stop:2148 length:852 start_codon:yes stop_codon:yes gene_type:complete